MYVLSFFKKGDTIQGGTLFKGGGGPLFKEIRYLTLKSTVSTKYIVQELKSVHIDIFQAQNEIFLHDGAQ